MRGQLNRWLRCVGATLLGPVWAYAEPAFSVPYRTPLWVLYGVIAAGLAVAPVLLNRRFKWGVSRWGVALITAALVLGWVVWIGPIFVVVLLILLTGRTM